MKTYPYDILDDGSETLPSLVFPGVVDGTLLPGAPRTAYIPAEAALRTGDRFVFVMTGVKSYRPYIRIGETTPDMEGTRIAITAPAWFFDAHAEDDVKASYVVQRVAGDATYSGITAFAITRKAVPPIILRKWFTANFQEFTKSGTFIPKRLAFLKISLAKNPTIYKYDAPPYCIDMSYLTFSTHQSTWTLDFTVNRVRFGVEATTLAPITIRLMSSTGEELHRETISIRGWFDTIVDAGGIASIELTGGTNCIDNLSVFPDKIDEVDVATLDENFDDLPVDNGFEETRLLPAWRVSAESSLIAVESASSNPPSHALVIYQSFNGIDGEMLHYFTPRIVSSPSRVALSLRSDAGYSQAARVVAVYEKRDIEQIGSGEVIQSIYDAPRYVSKQITISAATQTVELGEATSDEFLSGIYVEQPVGRANTIIYQEIIAT